MERDVNVAKAREKFSDLVEQVQYQKDTYIITRHGKPAVALVPIEILENWKRERLAFFESVRLAQQGANLTSDEADRLALEAVAAVRSKA